MLYLPRPPAGSCSTTATPWVCPTPRRCRRRTRWAWTTSPSTRARMRVGAMRSGSAPRRCRNSVSASRPPACAKFRARCARPAAWRSTSGASTTSRRNSKAGSSSCTSMPRGSRWRRASRCSRPTVPSWCRRSANTRWRQRGWRRSRMHRPRRRPRCASWPTRLWHGCATGTSRQSRSSGWRPAAKPGAR